MDMKKPVETGLAPPGRIAEPIHTSSLYKIPSRPDLSTGLRRFADRPVRVFR
jgi:hypothetical protein